MEYAPGGSALAEFEETKRQSKRMSAERCAEILADSAEGLAVLHAKRIVHRDVKPSNILLDARRRAMIADLGVAQAAGGPTRNRENRTVVAPHPGTLGFASPEHANGYAYLSPAADVYGLGATGCFLLTGLVPVGAGKRPSVWSADLPVWLDVLLARMMASDPAARPADGAAVARELREGLAKDRRERERRAAEVRDLEQKIESALKDGQLGEADAALEKLRELAPNDSKTYDWQGMVSRAWVLTRERKESDENRLKEQEAKFKAEREQRLRDQQMRERKEHEAKAQAERTKRIGDLRLRLANSFWAIEFW